MKNNVTKFDFCYGCGVCEITCPHKIISIRLNRDGFYVPEIDNPEKCTECGLCLNVCAHNDSALPAREREEIRSYSGWSKDNLVRLRCSSGGIGFEIGRFLIEKGYKAVGCKFNADENRAEHFVAETEDEFRASVGSKYIPSFTIPGFSKLNRKEKFFVTGTPCQIDSLRRWARKMKCEQNLVFLDFFCHGVPSMNLWKKYSAMLERKLGKLKFVSWRNKATGWCNPWNQGFKNGKPESRISWEESYCLFLEGEKGMKYSKIFDGDMFYGYFLGDVCAGKACYKTCKYKKGSSSADIRIGDRWGAKYVGERDGVNCILSFTRVGDEILEQLRGKSILREEPFDEAVSGQMQRCASPRMYTPWSKWLLRRSALSLRFIGWVSPYAYRSLLAVCYRKLKKLLRKVKG